MTAGPGPRPRDATGHAVTILPAGVLARRQARTLGEALRQVPGASIATSGGAGGQASVFLRGADASQTLVVIDGVRANDPASPSGAFDFGGVGLLPGTGIEVLRGANALAWGPQAIGGVIAVDTAAPGGEDRALLAEAGGRDRVLLGARQRARLGGMTLNVAGGWRTDGGVSALAGGAERDGLTAWRAQGRADTVVGGARLTGGLLVDVARIAIDAPFDPDPAESPVETRRRMIFVHGALAWGHGDGVDDGNGAGGVTHRLSIGRASTRRDGIDPVRPDSFNVYRIDGSGLELAYRGTAMAGPALRVGWGAGWERTRAATLFPATGADDADRASRSVLSVLGDVTVSPLPALTVQFGVRADRDGGGGRAGRTGTSHAIDAAWVVGGGDGGAGGRTVIRASRATGFRLPSLTEALLPFGNPDLRRETAVSHGLGVSHGAASGRWSIEATAWHRSARELITFDPVTFRSENVSRAVAYGIEGAARWRLDPAIDVTLALGWTRARDRSGDAFDGLRLARRPALAGGVTVDWRPGPGTMLGIVAQGSGDRFDDRANTVRVRGAATVTALGEQAIADGILLFGRIENLFAADDASVAGYSGTPRAVMIGLRTGL